MQESRAFRRVNGFRTAARRAVVCRICHAARLAHARWPARLSLDVRPLSRHPGKDSASAARGAGAAHRAELPAEALDRRAATGGREAMSAPRVAIIGGGLAGLAAALGLAEQGVHVDLFEARRTLGGRAASFRDP